MRASSASSAGSCPDPNFLRALGPTWAFALSIILTPVVCPRCPYDAATGLCGPLLCRPLQFVFGIVDRDLDILTAAIDKPLDPGKEFTSVGADVTDVIGRFLEIGEGLFILRHQLTVLRVDKECGAAADEVSLAIGGDPLPPLHFENSEEFVGVLLCVGRMAGDLVRGRTAGREPDSG